jgi:hypothetical protein
VSQNGDRMLRFSYMEANRLSFKSYFTFHLFFLAFTVTFQLHLSLLGYGQIRF